jgi:hypothetical protein
MAEAVEPAVLEADVVGRGLELLLERLDHFVNVLSSGSFRIDHTSPLEKRWGGWYVTGQHGATKHLGNLIIRRRGVPDTIDNSAGMNLQHAPATVDTAHYLTPHSDIVAPMVFELHAQGHNLIARANFLTRTALFQQEEMNRAFGKREDERWESTTSRIKDAGGCGHNLLR